MFFKEQRRENAAKKIKGNPKVSIIIPNKDKTELLKPCIESIRKLTTYQNYEIVIVENNSEDKKTFDIYEELCALTQVRLLTYPHKEFNYQKIINFAVRDCGTDFILQLNNDTELITPNWLELLIGYAQQPSIGAVGVKLLYPDMTIQHVGGILMQEVPYASHVYRGIPRDVNLSKNLSQKAQSISWVTGACIMSRKEIYQKVGFMDENFVYNYGDVDYCLKIRAIKKEVIINPLVELIHLESKTRPGDEIPEILEISTRDAKLFYEKWADELEKGDRYINTRLLVMN